MKKLKAMMLMMTLVCSLSVISNRAIAEDGDHGTLKGTILDAQSNEPIPFAAVVLKQNAKQITGTASDFEGNYIIEKLMPGKYDIEVTVIGYDKKLIKGVTVNALKTTIQDVAIEASVDLEEVKVIMDKKALKQMDVAYSVSEVYSDEINSVSGGRRAKRSQGYAADYIADPIPHNTEEYDVINENIFLDPISNPLSTFSIDVDAASYSNMRRMINNGQLPQKDVVRIEEMINYFDYDYPNPLGEDPFSITTEISVAPWNTQHKLVHIGLQGKMIDYDNLKASNLVFLIDVSGSMSDNNKLPLLISSMKLLVNELSDQDRVAIVVYAGAAGLVLPSTPASQKQTIIDALNNLQAGGSTAGGAGIKLAYKVALDNLIKDGNNRVILATDGDFNVGASSTSDMVRLIEDKRDKGVFLTITGFGMGNYKDGRMEQISNAGNGNYFYIDNIKEAKKVFVTEMRATLFTIAKDVKIQIEFNPDQVQAYRLIGYENRMLKAEDFNDDKKDAGELGAGHTVTALYEIIPVGVKSEFIKNVDPLKYQSTKIKAHYPAERNELLTVKFRYKDPDGSKSKLITNVLLDKDVDLDDTSDNFRFSASVASFGMILRDSEFKGTSSYSDVLTLAKASKAEDKEGYRSEFIKLVESCSLLDNDGMSTR